MRTTAWQYEPLLPSLKPPPTIGTVTCTPPVFSFLISYERISVRESSCFVRVGMPAQAWNVSAFMPRTTSRPFSATSCPAVAQAPTTRRTSERGQTNTNTLRIMRTPSQLGAERWASGRSARLQPQRRRQGVGAHHRLGVGACLVFPQILAARLADRGLVVGRDRLHRDPPAGKIKLGRAPACEIPVPPPLGAADRAHEDLVAAHRHPDRHR